MADEVRPVCIEDAAVTTTGAFREVSAVNDYIINDGPVDIIFTAAGQQFTIKPGEVNDVPFLFAKLTWRAASGTGAFRCFAHSPF